MSRRLRPALLVAALALLAACSEAVDPVLEAEQAFTLYGYLDPTAPRQAVRVFAVDGRLERYTEPVPIDADVRSTALATGDARVWRDSTVRFPDDTYGHVFYAAFTPAFSAAYRVRVVRSDGVAAEVTVETPPEVAPEPAEPVLLPVPILRVLYPGAPRLNEITVRYTVDGVTATGRPFGLPLTLAFRHDGRQEPVDGGWEVRVPFLGDASVIYERYFADGRPFGSTIALEEVRVEALVSSADWFSPAGVYDPDLLVQPGVFSNVENGFGFVGAGYRRGVTWQPGPEVLARVGFVPPP